MNREQRTNLKEAAEALLRAMIQTENARPGEERERAENRIPEAIARVNKAWREVQNQHTDPDMPSTKTRRLVR